MNGTELLAKYKVTIGIIFFVVVFVLVIYFVGKKAGKTKSISIDLPTDLADNKTLTVSENSEVAALAALMYNDMKGINYTHDMDAWNRLMLTTDRILIATYNYFNSKYGAGESLYVWIDGESSLAIASNFPNVKETILKRMNNLKLY